MNNIISQDFWCATLTKENPECKWQQLDEEVTHHLMIEQAVLGLNCKERCMIEATARTADGTEKSCMICHLIPSSVPNCQLTLSFKQVSLRLAAGDGPVYLTGTHSQEVEGADEFSDEEGEDAPALLNTEAEEGEEEEEESSDEEEIDEDKMLEELAAAQANKLKTFMKKDKKGKLAPPGPQSKKVEAAVEAPKPAAKKVEEKKEEEKMVEEKKEDVVVKQDVEMEESDEEEDSSEEEDDDEEEEENAEGKVEEKAPAEEEEDEDDDDDDDDDDNEVESDDDEEEEEDDEDDDEEESEEESDEEEEEPAPVTKKRKTEAATPVPVKANGKPAATKPSKKPQTPIAKPNLNELKKKLLASPSLPKKYEKFVNLMKNAHKVTDDKEIKSTWEFVQKNKK